MWLRRYFGRFLLDFADRRAQLLRNIDKELEIFHDFTFLELLILVLEVDAEFPRFE